MFAVVSARIPSAVSVPVAGPAVAPQMSSICESTAFSGTAVRHRRCGSIRDSKAPQRQARQPLSAASPLTRRGGLAVGTSNDEASRNRGNDGDEGGGAGGQAGSGGKGGSGGGDASQTTERYFHPSIHTYSQAIHYHSIYAPPGAQILWASGTDQTVGDIVDCAFGFAYRNPSDAKW